MVTTAGYKEHRFCVTWIEHLDDGNRPGTHSKLRTSSPAHNFVSHHILPSLNLYLLLHTVSSLQRCPLFRVFLIERFHCTYCTYVPYQIPYTTSSIPIPKSHWSNDSDVRQMAAPSCWVIRHDDITLMHIVTKGLHLVLYGLLHGPQVNGYVWGVGNQTPIRAKKSTRKIQSLLESGKVKLHNTVQLLRGASIYYLRVNSNLSVEWSLIDYLP